MVKTDMKIFTIIKEESKRIPDKNFVDINGLPLWRYLLSELDGLDVTVNTDSQKFLKEFQRSNLKSIKVLKRKQETNYEACGIKLQMQQGRKDKIRIHWTHRSQKKKKT